MKVEEGVDIVKWVRRDSVTHRRADRSAPNSWFFVKSFDPEEITSAYKSFFNDTRNFRPNRLYQDTQRSLYRREACMLEALGMLSRDLVPEVHYTDSDKLRIYMEYLPLQTYQDLLEAYSGEDTKKSCAEEMVDFLVMFHAICNTYLPQLKEHASKVGVPFRKPSIDEEVFRMEEHLASAMGYLASLHCGNTDFQQHLLRVTTDKSRRRNFRIYLKGKGIGLRETITKFIDSERGLSTSPDLLVHGDYQPQNIFYVEENGKRRATKLCDFTKARLGQQSDDLVSCLRNIHMYPLSEKRERFFLSQAQRYFTDKGTPAENLPSSIASVILSSYKSILYGLGNTSALVWKEISWFLSEQQRTLYQGQQNNKEELIKTFYLSGMRRLNEFYSSGSPLLTETIPQQPLRDTVVSQLSAMEQVFEACGITLSDTN